MKKVIIAINDFVVLLFGVVLVFFAYKSAHVFTPFFESVIPVETVRIVIAIFVFVLFCGVTGFWFVLSGIHDELVLSNQLLKNQNRILSGIHQGDNVNLTQ